VNARRILAVLLCAAAGCERAAPDVDAAKRLVALRTAAAARHADGPDVFDRNGALIASNPDFAPFVRMLARSGTATVETTLDPFVQRAAVEALGAYRGAIVAIDPRTNEILAVASTGPRELALSEQYEPGSIIKVLTGLGALDNGVNVNAMFPYTCTGELMIDGRHFGDWLPAGHGTLHSMDDALAVSCNVFFADLGLRLGRERLRAVMSAAGFDGQANLLYAHVPLGRTVGQIFNNFETALYAIGLEHERMNALHVAMVASMMANRGVLTTPLLVRRRRSLLGYEVASAPPQGRKVVGSPVAAETMVHAMRAVVENPRGTGRHAPVEDVSLALKTGTAGDKKSGLEALIMAFAPAESPKIAFGIIAEGAGPAELAGAKIAHDFVVRMKPRL
jgi:peptidoglycan glycosyltransferase